jgi:lipoyl(octanoyl) transferase
MDGFEPDEDVLPARSGDDRSLAFHLLGDVDYADMDALQSKLGRELRRDIRPRIIVLLCEHPASITVGRRGSRRHLLRMLDHEDRSAPKPRWVERSGGCILHGPGQLAVCVLAALEQFGWSHGEFRMRVHQGVLDYLRDDVRLSVSYADPEMGIWGRNAQPSAASI